MRSYDVVSSDTATPSQLSETDLAFCVLLRELRVCCEFVDSASIIFSAALASSAASFFELLRPSPASRRIADSNVMDDEEGGEEAVVDELLNASIE